MKKNSILKTSYIYTSILFVLFIVSLLFISSYNVYIDYTGAAKEIEKQTMLQVKRQLKTEVDFFKGHIDTTRKKLYDEMKNELISKIDISHNIAHNLFEVNKNKPQKEIESIVVEALREFAYNKERDYTFIIKLDGTLLLYPKDTSLEGKNGLSVKYPQMNKITKELTDLVKQKKEGFLEYDWVKDSKHKFKHKKTSYVKYCKSLDALIGSGLYFDDVEKVLQQRIVDNIEAFKFGKNKDKYIFAATYEGVSLTGLAKGENVYEVTDNNGLKIVQELIRTAKAGSGYIEYVVPFGVKRDQKKISYVTGIDEWGWYLGAGSALTAIQENIDARKQNMLENLYMNIAYIVFFGILFLLIFYVIFNLLKSKLEVDIEAFLEHLKKLVNKNKAINTKKIQFLEFEKIATQSNKILKNKQEVEEQLRNNEIIMSEQSKMAALGEMLGNIGHQWRQPLSVISTSATGMIMQKQHDLLSDEAFYKSCENINENAQYLSQTIEDFRNFIKGDSVAVDFNLKEQMDKFLKLVDSSIKKHQLKVILDTDENINMFGFSNELLQCFINIFNNSKDELLKKEEKDRFIFIEQKLIDGKVVIKFKDNAGGIDKSIIGKIFEPYFTTKHKSKGTGLGLHMTYQLIVDGMGGSIDVENVEYEYKGFNRKGALFTIVLPSKKD